MLIFLDAFAVCVGVVALAFTIFCHGPLLGNLANYYAVYHSWRGPYFRYGPNEFSINTTAALQRAMKPSNTVSYHIRGLMLTGHRDLLPRREFQVVGEIQRMVHQAANTLTPIDERKHGKKRRLISQAFSDAAFRGYEETIQEKINMSSRCNWFTFDVMCSIIFRIPWSSPTEKKYRHVPHMIEMCMLAFVKFVNDIIRQGMAMSAKGSLKGAFALLRDATDPETQKPLSNEKLCGESTILVVAGAEHTVQEVCSTFQFRAEVGPGPKVNSCKYLRAVIEESMRLSFSVPATVDGQYIPQGLEAGTCVYAIQHYPEIYPQPFKFVPERKYSLFAGFTPFTIGPRGCIAKPLAYIELSLRLSRILYAFDMRLPHGVKVNENDEYQLALHITAAKEGPLVEFRLRTVV
ncbi:cytochrome P450 [Aspergillus fruticulosus]